MLSLGYPLSLAYFAQAKCSRDITGDTISCAGFP